MGKRPRTQLVKNRRLRKCGKCGAQLNRQQKRCKRCANVTLLI